MRVTTFLRTAGEGPFGERKRHVLCQFHEGAIADGVDAHLVDDFAYEPTDVAVMFGGRPSTGHEPTQRVRRDICARHKGAFVLLETPFLGRKVYQRSRFMFWLREKLGARDRKRCLDHYSYYRIGINGLFQDDGDFNNRASPPDRWDELARSLKLDLKPYRSRGRAVLIVGQVPGDTSLRGIDIIEWMYQTALLARSSTDRPIIVRPHPVANQAAMKAIRARFRGMNGVTLDYPPRKPVSEMLDDCWVMIAYSSGATIDALIEGVPCITLSPANMAWPVSDHSLKSVEQPTLFPREQWLYDLAYAQWSPEEMRAGLAWRHLRPTLVASAQHAA